MTNNPRLVLDTNVLISAALIPEGKPNRVLSYVLSHGVLLFSPETLEEIETRIHRPKFHRYLKGDKANEYILFLQQRATILSVEGKETASSDPDDNKFLDVAVQGAADYLITGNIKDFPTSPFKGIPIVTPAKFLELVEA